MLLLEGRRAPTAPLCPDGGGSGLRPAPRTKPAKSPLREYVETLIGAAVLAVLIMTFVARTFTVDGPSMMPTLQDGQRLLVDRLTYRFKEPQRGDVIVFRYPANPRQHFIKRIIGVPGDEIFIAGGTVFVNGVALQEDYINGPMFTGRPFGPVIVQPGTYFVLGDNRNNSEDSRDRRVGLVPRENIVGRALGARAPPPPQSRLPVAAPFQALPPAAALPTRGALFPP
ncbi:MAG: signal peptidase I, partial [Bacillota bacterium]